MSSKDKGVDPKDPANPEAIADYEKTVAYGFAIRLVSHLSNVMKATPEELPFQIIDHGVASAKKGIITMKFKINEFALAEAAAKYAKKGKQTKIDEFEDEDI